MASTSLLTVIDGLLRDPAQRAAYASDPAAYLSEQGWEDLNPEDLAEAMAVARHSLAADVAGDVPAVPDGEDGFAMLDDVAGLEPLALTDVGDVASFDELPAFGSGAEEPGAPPTDATQEFDEPRPADDPDGSGLSEAASLPEVQVDEDAPVVAEAVATESAGLDEDLDDWLDPMNP